MAGVINDQPDPLSSSFPPLFLQTLFLSFPIFVEARLTTQELLTLVRDPTWQFIGAVLAIVAIYVAMKQRQKKALGFQVLSKTALLTRSEELTRSVSITFESREVSDIGLWLVKVKNHGNVPIAANDFEVPLALTFGREATILTTAVVDQHPTNLGATVQKQQNASVLGKMLLNPGDYVVVKTLVSGSLDKIEVSARIHGVSSIGNIPNLRDKIPVKIRWVTGVALTLMLLTELSSRTGLGSTVREWLILPLAITFIAGLVYVVEDLVQIIRSSTKERRSPN